MRSSIRLAPLALLLALGCGGGASAAESTEPAPGGSTGAEAPAPLGPLLSYVPEGFGVVARIDVARIRRSPLGPDIAGAIQASPAYQSWASGSGLEPIADLDAILIAGPALYADRRVIVLELTGEEGRARDIIMRIAVARGVTPAWREESGFAVVEYPDAALEVPHVVVLTGPHEVVIAPADDLSRVLDVARDHARRATDDTRHEPGLTFDDGEVMSMISDDPMPERAGYPAPPVAFRLALREDAPTERTQLFVHGTFASEADAAAADTWLHTQVTALADQLLVRMAQLDRPLTEARITHDGAQLELATDFTVDELRRALGALALYQAGAMDGATP